MVTPGHPASKTWNGPDCYQGGAAGEGNMNLPESNGWYPFQLGFDGDQDEENEHTHPVLTGHGWTGRGGAS